ncbi:MAG: DUF2244 domain-containing protein [Alphaproteobacteria bacterium]|nr:DUF2244 domain-containing protein [Alphaproteobacteria bacterium]
MSASAPTVYFDAWLRPHRSLNPRGVACVLALAAVPGFILGLVFLSLGAWPVSGFLGLDVALLWLAFRLNNRAAREAERVRLSETELTVDRHAVDGKAEHWSFQPNWLRVVLDDPPKPESRLLLSTHGRSLAIGTFLPPAERLEVADALRDALRRWRGPRL